MLFDHYVRRVSAGYRVFCGELSLGRSLTCWLILLYPGEGH